MLFDEVTRIDRTMSLQEILAKVIEFKNDYGNLEIKYDFGLYPDKIVVSDFPNEYFLNYSNEKCTLNKIIRQVEILEEDLFIYTNNETILFDNEVIVGIDKSTLDYSNQNLKIIDIYKEYNQITIETSI